MTPAHRTGGDDPDREQCAVCGESHGAADPCAFRSRSTDPSMLDVAAGVTTPAPDPLIGQQVGNFKIVRKLGTGGMGAVYLGEHPAIGSRVAIKFLHDHLAADKTVVDRFYSEARAVNLIAHENIVSIFDINQLGPNRHYLVMELLEGESLATWAREPVTPEQGIPVLVQALSALGAAHARGIVHRDLKPENVFLVSRPGKPHHVKLVDFGIAKMLSAVTSATQVGLSIGTPEYMSPEQWAGGQLDGRADLYAVGIIAYQIFTGYLPFGGDTILALFSAHTQQLPMPPRQLRPDLPASLEACILKALEKSPERRYASAAQMSAALEAVLRLQAPATPVPAPTAHTAETVVRAPTPLATRPKFPAKLVHPNGRTYEGTATDLSKGSAFLELDGAGPALFERVTVSLKIGAAVLDLPAEVVRQISPREATSWKIAAGVGLQFVALTPEHRARLERVLKGEPLDAESVITVDDPVAANALVTYLKAREPYSLLKVAIDVDCDEARAKARAMLREVEALRSRPLTPSQKLLLKDAQGQLTRAMDTLGNPKQRAQYDATQGNYRGIARALAAGLKATELDELRQAFMATRSAAAGKAHVFMVQASAHAAAGETERALREFENALTLDPLNLALHHKYWALKRPVRGEK